MPDAERSAVEALLAARATQKGKSQGFALLAQGAPILGLLLLWQVASMAGWVNPYLLPSPLRVATAILEAGQGGELGRHVAASVLRVGEGFGITVCLALPLAVLASFAPRLTAVFNPLLTFLRDIPPLALIPVLILWFGLGESSKLALIVLTSFFPVFMGAVTGLGSVDPRLVEMGRSLGFSRLRILQRIQFPESVPSLLNGLRLGLGYSWRAIIGAEMIAAASGLGYWILDAEEMARIDVVFAGIFVIGLLGILLDRAAYLAASRLLPWVDVRAQWFA
jgi:sulfonate transport system permease protein